MNRQVHAEDLLVLARKRELSEEEERRLAIALQSSRELECLYRAGLNFDAHAGLVSGDEARFSRLVERTLSHIDQTDGATTKGTGHTALTAVSRASLITRYFAASLALGLLLCVTLASAWDYVEKRAAQERAAQQAEQASKSSTRAALSRKRRPSAPTPAPTPVPAPPVVTLPPAPAPLNQGRKPTIDQALSASELPASELFARANQARRNGDIEAAISLYERLGQAYPNSPEAEDAKILRGNLLLIQRSPRAALRQFEEYHSGALSLEALWGRAQALRKLESADERAVLMQLVRDYPNSPYAEAAEKRLRELSP